MRKLFSSKNKVAHELKVGEVSLKLVQGNILDERSIALIVWNNRDLTGNTGVSNTVMSSGGEQLIHESRAWVLKNGRVPYGEAAVTSGGSLYFLNVVHAAVPQPCDSPQEFAVHFRNALANSFAKCEELYAKTMSLPGLSGEDVNLSLRKSAALQMKSIISYISNHPVAHCEEVRVVLSNNESVGMFLLEFERWVPAPELGKGLLKRTKRPSRKSNARKEEEDKCNNFYLV